MSADYGGVRENAEAQCRVDSEDVIVQLSFKRSRLVNGTKCLSIRYTMDKRTPFGPISSSIHIPCAEFMARGAEHYDAVMFKKLSAAISLEEADRLLEVGASDDFGASAAC